ncbi:lectin C-type domain protein [Teladorsagia circumcincta]|uniref:Lectin C-type domain protein n=1 Tax=Teladorsagia circumcincta TaxID=45464 RepID=A0A2G9URB3_TELCI|nr:lectin C-type domain protein [Teladorsagia circumcincta]
MRFGCNMHIRCYLFVAEPQPFGLAEDTCVSNRGHIVSVMNGFENAMLAESAVAQNLKSPFFVGMNKLQGNWSNSDGSAYTYTNWTPGQPGHCDSEWTYFQGTDSCYRRFFWATFDNAEEICVSEGGHLTSIHSTEENSFVIDIAESGNDYGDSNELTWMGLQQADYPTKTDWTWTDGTPFNFMNWAPKQPDNSHGSEHCAQIYSDYTGKDPTKDSSYRHWNDIPCATTMRAFVCKKPALH